MTNSNAYMNRYMKMRWRKRRAKAVRYLGGCCVDCGSKVDLEFDHIDPKTKLYSIARAASLSKKRFAAEVRKCTLRCRDCHRLKSKREGSFRGIIRDVTCVCGKKFSHTHAYAGHRAWCKV